MYIYYVTIHLPERTNENTKATKNLLYIQWGIPVRGLYTMLFFPERPRLLTAIYLLMRFSRNETISGAKIVNKWYFIMYNCNHSKPCVMFI